MGVPESAQGRCVDMHERVDGQQVPSDDWNSAACRAAAADPVAVATPAAAALTAFYQMLRRAGR